MSTRTITIYHGPHEYAVHEGERHSGPLSWDEMLGQIAAMTIPRRAQQPELGLFGMRTPEEWSALKKQSCLNIEVPRLSDSIASLREFVKWKCSRAGEMDAPLPIDQQPADVQGAMRALMALDGFDEVAA